MKYGALFLLLAAISTPCGAAAATTVQQHSLPRSLDYVDQLDLDCTLAHGYTCAEVGEDSFLQPDSLQQLIPAAYMRAWQAAYDDFQRISDLTDEQKDLKHYRLGFTENQHQYIVLLLGLALPYIDEQGASDGIVNAVYGRSTKYWIDKKTHRVVKRLFYK